MPTDVDQTCLMQDRRTYTVCAVEVVWQQTTALSDVTVIVEALERRRRLAREIAADFGGRAFETPRGDLYALFECGADAVLGALATQARLIEADLRIGAHVGEVQFLDDRPVGETLDIAAALAAFADVGGLLVSSAVKDDVAARAAACFETRGVRTIPILSRSIETFSVIAKETIAPGSASPKIGDVKRALQTTVLFAPSVSAPERAASPSLELAGTASLDGMRRGADAGERQMRAHEIAQDASIDATAVVNGDRPNFQLEGKSLRARDTGDRAPTGTGEPRPATEATDMETGGPTAPSRQLGAPTRAVVRLDWIRLAGAAPTQVFQGDAHDELARILTLRLGPIAPTIITRKLAAVPTLGEFIDRLAEEIPSSPDRAKFLCEVRALVGGPKN